MPSRGISRGRREALLAWDLVAIVASVVLAMPFAAIELVASEPSADAGSGEAMSPLQPAAVLFAIVAIAGITMLGERENLELGGHLTLLFRLVIVATVAVWLTLLGASAAHWQVDLDQLIVISLVLPLLWFLGRILLRSRHRQRVVLVGSGRVAAHITLLAERHPHRAIDIVGWIDDDPQAREGDGPPMLGPVSELPRLLDSGGVDRVIVCFSMTRDEEISAILRECESRHVDVDVVPRMFELVGPAPRSRTVGGFPLLSLTARPESAFRGAAKRCFDLVVAFSLLVLTIPVLAVAAVAVKLDSPGPVLYRSIRLGRRGRPFTMYKLRTMFDGADTLHQAHAANIVGGDLKRPDDVRITRVGRVLRQLSIDELPQLLNIISGAMSVVGPRPVLVTETEGVEGWASRRHDVRPGVTGLWQVLGRSTIPWEERMQLDCTYAKHWSLRFDLKILASTAGAVLSRRGAF
ncbi:MAG TPA: sugar transferase [Miltoncostaeaceae bacterium]|nr:sugar transferase [Miltoncostaeaceae bacterium]